MLDGSSKNGTENELCDGNTHRIVNILAYQNANTVTESSFSVTQFKQQIAENKDFYFGVEKSFWSERKYNAIHHNLTHVSCSAYYLTIAIIPVYINSMRKCEQNYLLSISQMIRKCLSNQ